MYLSKVLFSGFLEVILYMAKLIQNIVTPLSFYKMKFEFVFFLFWTWHFLY